MNKHPALQIHQLSVNYEKTPVLWDLSLEIPQGKLVAIIGPNGAGKSTFLKTALGLIKPIAGTVSFFGEPLKKVRRKVAYVPQRESVDWDFPITVFDLVLMGRYGRKGIMGRPSRQDREDVSTYLAMVGLESFASRQISQLSGGQQQRAFLARALIQEADLYLMDEPFTGIDISSSKTIISILQQLRDQGKTLFVVHHHLGSVTEIFDWVILLNMCLVGCGSVQEVFTPELIQKAYGKESLLLDEATQTLTRKNRWLCNFVNLLDFFTDPIMRAPTIASMLMCMVAALVGVLVFVRKRALLGEALSHATYPGVTGAIVIAGCFNFEKNLPLLVLVGAFLSSLLGFWVIELLEKKLKVSPDAALGAVLGVFFGIGVTIASFAQNSFTHLYRQMQTYLYGQAATMTDIHIFIYGILALLVLLFIYIFYPKILAFLFDAEFAKTSGSVNQALNAGIFLIIVLSLVIGVRCVGVILMSAMLIAPATAARQFTNRLTTMFWLAGIFGSISGFLGVYSSVLIPKMLGEHYSMPTGPMIVLVSGGIALYALFFAPSRGLICRYIRVIRFRGICSEENLLKALWRSREDGHIDMEFGVIAKRVGVFSFHLHFLLHRLIRKNMLQKQASSYTLTPYGMKRGARIVRLHRLWEVYLVHSLGLKVERVHKSAEEMEHILTNELEQKLTQLLDNPTQDPHRQPIPAQEEVLPHVL